MPDGYGGGLPDRRCVGRRKSAGCGGLDCGANGQCVGLVSAACVCEGNFIGQFCETECDCGGNATALAVAGEAGRATAARGPTPARTPAPAPA